MIDRDVFVAGLGFVLDDFQVRGLDAVDNGESVLVAAPTGAGKTVVGEYAVASALAEGAKAFYTTPLKALSNQKFGDLVSRHGAANVGLLTGDNSIRGDAPIVVMTTEVLRNMIYADAPALRGLRFVILDEVHYLENAGRGPVWEEVIIHSPPQVQLVCLSATVSNAEQFADWLRTVRGAATAVIEHHRPVELTHLYLAGDRSRDELALLPTFVDGHPNAMAADLDPRSSRRRRAFTPRRAEVIELLEQRGMLPAIVFVFSRAGCDDAVRSCRAAGLRLTSSPEREEIRAIAEAKVGALTDADLRVLGYGEWLDSLEAGLAAHHAGMVPPFKEAVEACFAAGLVKAVFATETLALGINMPARTVAIESLSKFSGESHEILRPGEYVQLTGRAGRRGIDNVGYAVVLWSPFVTFGQVAELASTRSYPLTSAFHPTYNMAANLVRRCTPDQAHHLLNLSFAQYHADADVVRLEAQTERLHTQAAAARARATCERGDVEEYRRLIDARDPRAVLEAGLGKVRPGDVIALRGGPAAVISTARRGRGDLRIAVVLPDATRRVVNVEDLESAPTIVGHVTLPEPYRPHARVFLRAAAASLRTAKLRKPPRSHRQAADAHPVASCPDRRVHLRAAERAARLEADAARAQRSIAGRTDSLARQFDLVLQILEERGYIDGWELTPAGQRLAGLYHECDLLIAEVLGAGGLDGLDAPAVAAIVSTFTFAARGPGDQAPAVWFPSVRARETWQLVERAAADVIAAEERVGLDLTRPPDAGFVAAAHAWAAGQDLGPVIADAEMSGGDFVRNIKQLIDLLRQLADIAPAAETRAACRRAADHIFRGVVAASSVLAGATA